MEIWNINLEGIEIVVKWVFVKFRSNTWKVLVQFNYFAYSMLARIKRGLPPKYAGTALSIILWSWMNLKLDSGSFWESWEHLPGLGSGTFKKDGFFIRFVLYGNFLLFYLHISNWQPIWVGSLLFLKWTFKSVQDITNLKGTNCVSTNGIFRCGKNTVDYFGLLSIFVTSFNYGTDRFWN